jgi:hypothetical protein
MKKTLQALLIGIAISQSVSSTFAQTVVTGPSSAQSPYLLPVAPGYTITSILTVSQTVGSYTAAGILDGAGAYDNNDGTFTMLINHEIGNNIGAVRAHGQSGAFVSKWIINKNTLAVVSGADLIQNVNVWNASTGTYSLYNAQNTSSLANIGRLCSGDLPDVSALYNSYTGKGTQTRIFLSGEEIGAEGRAFAHIATGPNAGTSYELPHLGKFSWENAVSNPRRSDKTIVAGFDDTTPGQVYIYVGNKANTGTEIARAGLTGGILYGVAVSGAVLETQTLNISPNTTFSLVNLGTNIASISGASLQTLSNNLGVTQFLRPEDGAWDPSNPKDLYFVTTNNFTSPSRMWRLRFTDIENPQLGGTITAVLDGTEGGVMLDNFCIDNSRHVILQEDVGGQAHLGKMWEYDIVTDGLLHIATHDANRFITGVPNFLTQDEEASGIFDAQSILGPGAFLFVDQAHYSIPSPVMEGGQILMLRSTNTATSNPEVNLQGNAVSIPSGNTAISAGNNTDFGTFNTGVVTSKVFNIQNTGTGPLWISSMEVSGPNAGDFVILNQPTYPLSIAAGSSQTFVVQFTPGFAGTRSATISVNNNDFDENLYDFSVQGVGAVSEINVAGNSVSITDGNTAISAANNTDFGNTTVNSPVTKTFAIQNTGTGTLTISNITMSGANAGLFTLVTPTVFPLNLISNTTQSITVQFLPTSIGNYTATVNINNNDSDESAYDFVVGGAAVSNVGIQSIEKTASFVSVFPNPAKDDALVSVTLDKAKHVSVSIFDVTGKQVSEVIEKDFHEGNNHLSLNTSDLKNGVYFVQVTAGANTNQIKLIVKH